MRVNQRLLPPAPHLLPVDNPVHTSDVDIDVDMCKAAYEELHLAQNGQLVGA
jgi:hypothetical protein